MRRHLQSLTSWRQRHPKRSWLTGRTSATILSLALTLKTDPSYLGSRSTSRLSAGTYLYPKPQVEAYWQAVNADKTPKAAADYKAAFEYAVQERSWAQSFHLPSFLLPLYFRGPLRLSDSICLVASILAAWSFLLSSFLSPFFLLSQICIQPATRFQQWVGVVV